MGTPGHKPGGRGVRRARRAGLGTLGSLASLGGMWNAEAVPTSRTTVFALLAAVALLGVVTAGLPVVVRRAAAIPLLVLAVVAVVVPAVSATGLDWRCCGAGRDRTRPGGTARRSEVGGIGDARICPGGRRRGGDPAPMAATDGDGCGVLCGVNRGPARSGLGAAGKLQSVRYPTAWPTVSRMINDHPGPVAVLPAGTMRRFSWSGRHPCSTRCPAGCAPTCW
ncbi:transmembrane domain protein [Mycobacterium xenopi 4042]|uniref:Transmembrane domain protein n=1 Tax=Mycobacterium xenopi 4042 TaxID=1299334 RepID=X7ZB47_MYCXE|nr:transmembrane domain protein [Mycobacterium xenopi 4042]